MAVVTKKKKTFLKELNHFYLEKDILELPRH
jgi:hypothetical protein